MDSKGELPRSRLHGKLRCSEARQTGPDYNEVIDVGVPSHDITRSSTGSRRWSVRLLEVDEVKNLAPRRFTKN
jgi:hypothetical protein